jgi:hypothetical protein
MPKSLSMKLTRVFPLAVLLSAILFAACRKKEEQSTVRLRMTDKPTALEEVNIDLTGVMVKLDKDTASWLTMQANPGIYNLLALQNGVDTLIAQGSYPTNGIVKEIRLILGNNNTVKENGMVSALTVPSGSESGLKIKVDKKLQATLETLVIDFDAALSVKKESDGYKLRPVIKLK